METDFYPRPPRGGRPEVPGLYAAKSKFLSTPSARRATRWEQSSRAFITISIHALREEGDAFVRQLFVLIHISIHALREEGDAYHR